MTSSTIQPINQVQSNEDFDREFYEVHKTSCPIKFPQEVAYRPIGYIPVCACSSESETNPNCSIKINVYKIFYECRPRPKDSAMGCRNVIYNCLIDLCENHYNRIKNENCGKLPTFLGWNEWDAMDTISAYCD